MASEAVFPAFIRATYQETSDGVPAFERAMQTSVNRARKAADVSMEEVQRELERSLFGGKADFGADRARAASAAADARAKAARSVANALATSAAAEADYSAATQVSIAAARRLADEEEHAARAAGLNVIAVERMAEAARRCNVDLTALSNGQIVARGSANAHRQAQMMLGQQMQDAAIQMQLGINPLMILTQQGSQAAFSLAQMGGRAAAVGRFLSSPWTAALLVAGTALSGFIGKSEEAADALEKVKFSSDSVGDAQGILGNVMDITTGKISTQRQELIGLAIAQTKVAAIQAQARAAALRNDVLALQQPTTTFSGGLGGGLDIRRRAAGAEGAISRAFLAGEIDSKTVVQRLDNLRKVGVLTDQAFADAAKSVASLGVELANEKTFRAAERLINQVGSASDRRRLLKPAKDKPVRASNDNEAQRLYDQMLEARYEAQGNVQKLARDLEAKNAEWGKDQVTLGERMINQAKDLADLESARADGARQITEHYLQQLDTVQRIGGSLGDVAGIVAGIANDGDFFGVGGPLGRLLNVASPMVGDDGWKEITSKLDEIFGGEGKFKQSMTGVLQAAGVGNVAGSLVFGQSSNKLGSAIGGVLGKEAGEALGKMAGGLLGKLGGPLGSIAGGILGSAVAGLLVKPKWGTAVVTGNGESDVQVAGNKAAYRSNANLAGTSIQGGLDAIAEQLGANLGDYQVSIGQYKSKWRVSTAGRSGKLKKKYGDVTDFGKNGAEDAIKFAIADAVKDGALIGLRASTQALLAKSSDVEAQLQKALDFESVFTRLKEYRDPVGAALDTLDKEFNRLKKIFEEAGASAGEYAELEELYGLERAKAVKEAGERVTASLKSLFDELTVGNDARSLRERLVAAQASYSPLAQRVAAGDTAAYDDDADAARTRLDIQRQISGSGEDYFRLLDEVTGLTKGRIDAETNIASIAAARDSIFAKESLAPVVSATEQQTNTLVSVMKSELGVQTGELRAISANIVTLTRTVQSQPKSGIAASKYPARANF